MRLGIASNVCNVAALTAVLWLIWFPAAAQSTAPPVDDQVEAGDEDDLTRPARSFDLRYRFEDRSVTDENDHHFLIFRLNYKVDFDPQWRLGLRLDMPVTAVNQRTSSDPDGDLLIGGGRPLFEAFIARTLDDRWATAIGSQIVSPPFSGGEFANDAWDALPEATVRYMLPELGTGSYFAPLVRYDISLARGHSSSKTSNLRFGPELKVMLPDQWFVSAYPSPDIRVNFGDPLAGQTGRLFLPIDGMVGRRLSDNTVVALEVSEPIIRDYPVYLFKIEARLVINF